MLNVTEVEGVYVQTRRCGPLFVAKVSSVERQLKHMKPPKCHKLCSPGFSLKLDKVAEKTTLRHSEGL